MQLCYIWMHLFVYLFYKTCICRTLFSKVWSKKNKQTKEQPEHHSLTWVRWQAGSAELSGQRSPRHELTEPWSLLGSCATSRCTTSLCCQHWTLLFATSSHTLSHTFFFFIRWGSSHWPAEGRKESKRTRRQINFGRVRLVVHFALQLCAWVSILLL